MSIPFAHSIDVPQSPATVFAFLDDLSLTPQWLGPCTGLENLTSPRNAVGDRLKYTHNQGAGPGTMEGEITARQDGRHLAFRFWDASFEVAIDYRLEPADRGGTRMTHAIDITPKSFLTKLAAPMIRGALPKQTLDAMEKVREMLAARDGGTPG